MKKLLGVGLLFLLSALSAVTASPLPLLIPMIKPQSFLLGISDADLTAITGYAANNQAMIIASLINSLDIGNDVMVLPGVKNKIPMPKLTVGKGFRPFSATQQFKTGQLKYTDRYLTVYPGKRELQINPEDYENTYLAWMNSAGSSADKSQNDIPYAAFMWDLVIRQLSAEINDETAYKGFDNTTATVYNAGSTYSAGNIITYASTTNNPNNVLDYWLCLATTTAGQNPDNTPAKWQYVSARAVAPGLESYILTEISGSNISPVATGAITGTAGVAIAAFTKLFRAFSPAYKSNGIIISCSYTDYEFLIDDLLVTYSKYTRDDIKALPFIMLPNSNAKCIVKPASWLGQSRRLIAGPYLPNDPNGRHMNLYMGTDLLSDLQKISIKTPELWNVNAGIKVRLGFQIQDVTAIKVGDQS